MDKMVHALESDGYFVGVRLKPDVLRELRAHCVESVCYADRRADLAFRIDERDRVEQQIGARSGGRSLTLARTRRRLRTRM
jgi:hypothetical protein